MCGRVVRCIFCSCSLCLCSLSLSLSLFLSLFQSFFICLSLSASAIMAMLASQSTCRTTSPQCSTEAETEFKARKHARVSVLQSQEGRTESLKSIRLESMSTWNLAQRLRRRNYKGRGRIYDTSPRRTLPTSLSSSKQRPRPASKKNFKKKRKTANSRGSATGIGSGNQHRISKTTHTPDSRSFKPRHRSSNENSTARTSGPTPGPQDDNTPKRICTVLQEAAHISAMPAASLPRPLARHLRTRCGRRGRREIESGRTLSPEKGILLPLVEMPRSRANRILSSELDTGIGAASSALIRGLPVKSAAAASVS